MDIGDKTIKVDIQKKLFQNVKFKQFDNGINLNLNLMEDGISIDLTGYEVNVFFKFKDEIVQNRTCTIGDSMISVLIDSDITNNEGRIDSEFVLSKNGRIATIFSIWIDIVKSIPRSDIVQAQPRWDIIQELIDIRNAKLQPTLDRLTSECLAKIQDIENRWNTLTSQQQQDAEVIDARNGEISLKIRLDKDVSQLNTKINDYKSALELTIKALEDRIIVLEDNSATNEKFENLQQQINTINNELENLNGTRVKIINELNSHLDI